MRHVLDLSRGCILCVQGIRESSVVDATLSKVRLQQSKSCCVSYMNEGLPLSGCNKLFVLPQLSNVWLATALTCFHRFHRALPTAHANRARQSDVSGLKTHEPCCPAHYRLMR